MSDATPPRSDFYGALERVDFGKLADRHGVPVERLRTVLDTVVEDLEHAVLSVRPANKKRFKPIANQLERLMTMLEEPHIDARLVIALINQDRHSDANREGLELDEYVSARSRVDEALEALRDLAEIVGIAEKANLSGGRPSHEVWFDAGITLKNFWVDELKRDPTISGHPDDGRDVFPSAFLEFVAECLQSLGAGLSETKCRTLLLSLRAMEWSTRQHVPSGIT